MKRGGIVDRGQNTHDTFVIRIDRYADTTELPFCLFFQILVLVGLKEGAILVHLLQHAVRSHIHQIAKRHIFHKILLGEEKHFHQHGHVVKVVRRLRFNFLALQFIGKVWLRRHATPCEQEEQKN